MDIMEELKLPSEGGKVGAGTGSGTGTLNMTGSSGNLTNQWPTTKSAYIDAYEFEVYDIQRARLLLTEYRYWAITICGLYVLCAFLGQAFMRKREAYTLRRTLALWNIVLAVFSIVGFIRTFPEVYFIVSGSNGFYESVCTRNVHNYATAFWALTFTLSKFVELGDTAFIVLRKQKLIFLHWYHHITVLIMTWIYFENYEPCFRWFGTMNFFVHSCMYSYFALKSLKVKVPRNFAMLVTVLQIAQMIVGLYINIYTYYVKYTGQVCERPMSHIYGGLSIYGTYFLLFLHFFFHAYFVKPKSKVA